MEGGEEVSLELLQVHLASFSFLNLPFFWFPRIKSTTSKQGTSNKWPTHSASAAAPYLWTKDFFGLLESPGVIMGHYETSAAVIYLHIQFWSEDNPGFNCSFSIPTSLSESSQCFSNHFIHLSNVSISCNSSKNLYQRMWAAERRGIADQRRPAWLALKAPASVPSTRCHQNHHHQGSNGHRDRHRCQNDLIGF